MSAEIFISYRRKESRWPARIIYDRLCKEFKTKQIFIDIDGIPLGTDFQKVIVESVGQCEVLVCIIGANWVDCKDDDGIRRLDKPDDFVRLEIATALERNIPIIPVLFDSVPPPRERDLPDNLKALTFRNGLPISESSLVADCLRLATAIKAILNEAKQRRAQSSKPKRLVYIVLLVAAMGLGLLNGGLWFTTGNGHKVLQFLVDNEGVNVAAAEDPVPPRLQVIQAPPLPDSSTAAVWSWLYSNSSRFLGGSWVPWQGADANSAYIAGLESIGPVLSEFLGREDVRANASMHDYVRELQRHLDNATHYLYLLPTKHAGSAIRLDSSQHYTLDQAEQIRSQAIGYVNKINVLIR